MGHPHPECAAAGAACEPHGLERECRTVRDDEQPVPLDEVGGEEQEAAEEAGQGRRDGWRGVLVVQCRHGGGWGSNSSVVEGIKIP
jgi:hypothetical protein